MTEIAHEVEVIRAEISRILEIDKIKDAFDLKYALHYIKTYVVDLIDLYVIDNKIE